MLKVGVVLSILFLASCGKVDVPDNDGLVEDVKETKIRIIKAEPCEETAMK